MDAKGIEPKETVSASKKLSRQDAAELVKAAKSVIVAKGSSKLPRRESDQGSRRRAPRPNREPARTHRASGEDFVGGFRR